MVDSSPFDVLRANTSIRELYLGDNHIGDIGAEACETVGLQLQVHGFQYCLYSTVWLWGRGLWALGLHSDPWPADPKLSLHSCMKPKQRTAFSTPPESCGSDEHVILPSTSTPST